MVISDQGFLIMGIYTIDNEIMSLENGTMDTPLYVYHNGTESLKVQSYDNEKRSTLALDREMVFNCYPGSYFDCIKRHTVTG